MLKGVACYIKDSVESSTSIRIPSINSNNTTLPGSDKGNIDTVETKILDNITQDPNKWISIAGIIVLGVVGLITVLCFSDVMLPETTRSIPIIGEWGHTINSSVTSFFSSFTDYFKPTPPSDPLAPPASPSVQATSPMTPTSTSPTPSISGDSVAARVISRSSSLDSNRTVRPGTSNLEIPKPMVTSDTTLFSPFD